MFVLDCLIKATAMLLMPVVIRAVAKDVVAIYREGLKAYEEDD